MLFAFADECVFDHVEVFALQLFTPSGDLLHSGPPVVDFHQRPSIDALFLPFLFVIQKVVDVVQPLYKVLFIIGHFVIFILTVLGQLFRVETELFLSRSHALHGLLDFSTELLGEVDELFNTFVFALVPLTLVHPFNELLVDQLHTVVEEHEHLLVHFQKQHFRVLVFIQLHSLLAFHFP